MIRIGDLQIHIIQESILHMDAGGAFGLVPRALFGRLMPPAADNTVAMPNHCLLVQTDGRNILIDVGVGDKMPEKARLALRHEQPRGTMHDALQRLGLAVSDIDLVINTHLHNDHCGGNTRYAADGAPVAVFPNAEYVVQRREYEDAMFPNERTRATYLPENYAPLVERGDAGAHAGPHERDAGKRRGIRLVRVRSLQLRHPLRAAGLDDRLRCRAAGHAGEQAALAGLGGVNAGAAVLRT
jgi:glyoxylase-like metal-dependent hydrolase (beta-lactamase superfamily II)